MYDGIMAIFEATSFVSDKHDEVLKCKGSILEMHESKRVIQSICSRVTGQMPKHNNLLCLQLFTWNSILTTTRELSQRFEPLINLCQLLTASPA